MDKRACTLMGTQTSRRAKSHTRAILRWDEIAKQSGILEPGFFAFDDFQDKEAFMHDVP